MKLHDIETPAAIINESVARHNIERFQNHCSQNKLALRPHIKTHKLPHFAKMQIDAGAIGITCQKLSEAEAMANAGIDDILITYNILGSAKLSRLQRLAAQVKHLAVTADNVAVIEGLASTFKDQAQPLPVMVECDTGANRCGVMTPAEVLNLASRIDQASGLTFHGLMTYPPRDGAKHVQSFIDNSLTVLTNADIDCPVVSSGGSPNMWSAGDINGVTEYRIGTYIYNDRSLVTSGVCSWDDCALCVMTTVVSAPAPGRAIVDAGSKTLTSDLLGLAGYGHVLGHDDVTVSGLSEEHGTLTWPQGEKFDVGQRVYIVPNHVCVVSNMLEYVWIKGDDNSFRKFKVEARGGVI